MNHKITNVICAMQVFNLYCTLQYFFICSKKFTIQVDKILQLLSLFAFLVIHLILMHTYIIEIFMLHSCNLSSFPIVKCHYDITNNCDHMTPTP